MTPDRLRNFYTVVARLEKKIRFEKRSYKNYQNVDISIKKWKQKSDAHYEGVIMKLIEKEAKEKW